MAIRPPGHPGPGLKKFINKVNMELADMIDSHKDYEDALEILAKKYHTSEERILNHFEDQFGSIQDYAHGSRK